MSSSAALGFSIRATSRDNVAPVISGKPATSVVARSTYMFVPTAHDANSDPLRFSIVNRPAWATVQLAHRAVVRHAGSWPTRARTRISRSTAPTVLAKWRSRRSPSRCRAPPIVRRRSAARRRLPSRRGRHTGSARSPWTRTRTRSASAFRTARCGQRSAARRVSSPARRPRRTSAATQTSSISVSDGKASAALAPFTIKVAALPNKAPTIAGAPATQVNAGSAYSFRPTAVDADGDTLTFSIANRPAWAAFNTATGQLSGTPSGGQRRHVRKHRHQRERRQSEHCARCIPDHCRGCVDRRRRRWSGCRRRRTPMAPTLTNLAGYRIVYGKSAAQLDADDPGRECGHELVCRRRPRAGHLLLRGACVHEQGRGERRLERRREGRALMTSEATSLCESSRLCEKARAAAQLSARADICSGDVRCCLLNVGYSRAKPSKGGDAKPPVRTRDAQDSGVAGRIVARLRATSAVTLQLQHSAVALLPCVIAACAGNPRN